MKTDLFIEWNGQQIDHKVLIDTVKEMWKAEGNKVKDLEQVELYFKPEDSICYYVINGEQKGHFQV